jgi:hypothetical protein
LGRRTAWLLPLVKILTWSAAVVLIYTQGYTKAQESQRAKLQQAEGLSSGSEIGCRRAETRSRRSKGEERMSESGDRDLTVRPLVFRRAWRAGYP